MANIEVAKFRKMIDTLKHLDEDEDVAMVKMGELAKKDPEAREAFMTLCNFKAMQDELMYKAEKRFGPQLQGHWNNMNMTVYQKELDLGRKSTKEPWVTNTCSMVKHVELKNIKDFTDVEMKSLLTFVNAYNTYILDDKLLTFTKTHGFGLVYKQKSGDQKILAAALALVHPVETPFKFPDKRFANTYCWCVHPAFRNMELGITLAQEMTRLGYHAGVLSGYHLSLKAHAPLYNPLLVFHRPIDIRKALRCGLKFPSVKREGDKDNRRDIVNYKVEVPKLELRPVTKDDINLFRRVSTELTHVYRPDSKHWNATFASSESPFKTYVVGGESIFSLYICKKKFKDVVATVGRIILFAGPSTARPDCMKGALYIAEQNKCDIVTCVELGHMNRDLMESFKFIRDDTRVYFFRYNYTPQMGFDEFCAPLL